VHIVIWLPPVVLAFAAPLVALAGSSPDSLFQLVLIEENSNFSIDGRDRHYTNGAQISFLSPRLPEGSFADTSMRWLGQNAPVFVRPGATTDNRLEWLILGQGIFTPQDHSRPNPSTNDRPYAAWLYTGLNLIQNQDDHVLTSLSLQVGIVGSWALGHQVQNDIHSLFGEEPVRGWHYQLSNQFGFVATWNRNWRFNQEIANGYSWEFVPSVSLAAGNVYTYAQAGGILRWGLGLKATWGPDPFSGPGYTGTGYFDPSRAGSKWGFDFYAGAVGRLMAVNIFLDGNTLQNSRSVDKRVPVGDLLVGAEFFYTDRFRVDFVAVVRSPEFRQQRGPDTFGGVTAQFGL
jgi:hypothetical protein